MPIPGSAPQQPGATAGQVMLPSPDSLGVQTAIAGFAGLVSGLLVLIALFGLTADEITLIPIGPPALQIVLHLIAAATLGVIAVSYTHLTLPTNREV